MTKVIGNGLISNAILKCINNSNIEVVFFASGVSNSLEENPSEFDREKELLNKTIIDNISITLVYFSSCSIYEKSTPYTRHKIKMEELVKEKCNSYIIYRLPQAVGISKNKHTLMNFLYEKIKKKEGFQILKGARRNIIDVEDVASIAITMSGEKSLHNKTINIATPHMQPVENIVKAFEELLHKKAIYDIKGFQESYEITIETMSSVIDIDSYFSKNSNIYTKKIIEKYY